ncbi:hypothetical protein Avbf_09894, partial [Armadillidium vulgare]
MSTLDATMKFYKKSVLQDMEAQKRHKTTKEKESINADIAFMQSMITDRKASYSGIDKVNAKVVEKRQKRTYDEAFPKETIRFEPTSSSSDESVGGGGLLDPAQPALKLKGVTEREFKSGEHIFVPHDILKNPNVVAWSVRNNVSNTKNELIRTYDGFCLRRRCFKDKSKCQFSPSISSISTTPYQQTNKGQMESVSKNGGTLGRKTDGSKDTDDRLPVLVSGANGTKLLGQHTAACVCLQRELDRPLLWFACRRHVGEVMLSDCWDSLNIEASSGPNISIFTRFKNHYLQLLPVNKAAYYYPELPRATEKEQESLANCFREFL